MTLSREGVAPAAAPDMTTPRVTETRRHGQASKPQNSTAAKPPEAEPRVEPRVLQAARRLRWAAGPIRDPKR